MISGNFIKNENINDKKYFSCHSNIIYVHIHETSLVYRF